MDSRWVIRGAGVAVLSGVLIVAELSDASNAHASYNVPAAPTVNAVDFTPTSNVDISQLMPSIPMHYQTLAQATMVLEING
jgi:hypothetical protein